MQYSPKLKTAAEEIKAILEKHDIGAAIVLHTPGFTEYVLKVNPSYSCAFFEGPQLRIKSNLQKDFNGDKQAQAKKLNDTVNLIDSLAIITGKISMGFYDMLDLLKSKYQLYTSNSDETSHIQQNN